MYDAALALQALSVGCASPLQCNSAWIDGGTSIDNTDVVDIGKKAMGL